MAVLKGLYAIADTELVPAHELTARVKDAILGGSRIIQYRDKTGAPEKRYRQAKDLASICREYKSVFIINDDIDLASRVQADGVHLGREDESIDNARAALGAGGLIGISCYNDPGRARLAAERGADYIALGRFFPSCSKPDAVSADITLLRQVRQQVSLPIVAIGGITADNGKQLIEAGADMLAAIHSVFGQDDTRNAARKIARQFY